MSRTTATISIEKRALFTKNQYNCIFFFLSLVPQSQNLESTGIPHPIIPHNSSLVAYAVNLYP